MLGVMEGAGAGVPLGGKKALKPVAVIGAKIEDFYQNLLFY